MEGDKKKKKGLFSIPSLNEMKEASKISTDGNKLSLFRAGRKDSEPVEPIPSQQTVDLDRAVRKGPLQASANRARTSSSVTASNHGSVSAGDVVRGLGAEAQRKTLTKWSERSEESGKLQCRSEGIAKEGKRPNIYTDTDSGGTSTSEETFSRATSSATDRPSGSATDRPSGSTADGRRGSATHGPSGSETHRPSDSATHRPSGCAADGPSGSATDRPNSSEAAGTTVAGVTYNPHAIIINPIQKNNPVMKQIRNVPWEMGNIVPDFVLGRSTCALFLSVRYHSLHPNYIHSRLKELGKQYELRILLVLADMSECQKVLHELAKIAILADLTLIVAWSYDEAGRYLETYKAYENKSPDQLMERVDSDFSSRVTESLTTVKKVNKTDAATLLNTFKTMEKIVTASKEELSLCPGLGPQKAQRLHDLFHEPFIRPKKSRLEE